MLIIYPKKSTDEYHSDLPDYPFMKACKEVLANAPDTWKRYTDTPEGKCSIISMEFNELMKAKDTETKKNELIHLASACLNLWRTLNAV